MTREEAINTIKANCYFAGLKVEAQEALNMAIKALETQEKMLNEINNLKIEQFSSYYDLYHETIDIINKYAKGV